MLHELKAFAHIGPMVDNAHQVVAPIGELSPIGITYSREKSFFSTQANPGHGLIVFSNEEDGVRIPVDTLLANQLIGVNAWTYNQASSGAFNSGTESYRSKFVVEFGTRYELWNVGAMVRGGPNVFAPSFIEIRELADSNQRYKIWYANEAFVQQYDEFEMVEVGPVESLDVFFGSLSNLQAALTARNPVVLMEAIETVKDGYPETLLRSDMFEAVHPSSAERIPTYWNTIHYGIAGNNIDSIKINLREYILANSTHTQEEWTPVLPDIFRSTEFIFVPQYDKVAVPDRQLSKGIYSSTSKNKDALASALRLVKGDGYYDEWIEEELETVALNHRCVQAAVIGNPDNRNGIVNFFQRYPDYVAVKSTDTADFGLMSPDTRAFVLMMATMMEVADTISFDQAPPIGFNRLVRDGVLYITRSIHNFQFLVVTKVSFLDPATHGLSDVGEP